MLKLLLVDDESTIRKGMLSCIRWAEHGIDVVGEAANGEEALHMALTLRPHIILTDIRMPVMDGIELVCQVRKLLPECKIIIMSGYDEFDYAKRLMGMRVTDYLLKPVDENELLSVTRRLEAEIKKEERDKTHAAAAEWLRYENAPQLKAQLMHRILRGEFKTPAEIEKWALALGVHLRLTGCPLSVLMLAIDPFTPPDTEIGSEEEKLLHYAVTNIAEEIISEQADGFLSYGEGFPPLGFVGLIAGQSSVDLDALLTRIKALLLQHLDQRVFWALGPSTLHPADLAQSYEAAEEALNARLYQGRRSFIKVALRYMEDNFSRNISLAEVAGEACVTPNYLSRVFKEEMNSSFVEWMNQLRVAKAKELLRTSTLKMYEIAELVGYQDYKYFVSVFKKTTGSTPKEFLGGR